MSEPVKLLEKINDLIDQATKERSHFYTKSVLIECQSELTRLMAVERAYGQFRRHVLNGKEKVK